MRSVNATVNPTVNPTLKTVYFRTFMIEKIYELRLVLNRLNY